MAKAKKTKSKSKKSTRSTAVTGTRAQARHELACRQRGLDGKRLPREKRKKCARGARPLRDKLNKQLVSMAK